MDYPATLPAPLRAGYNITPENNIIRSEMTNGRARQRVAYTSIPAYADLSFLFTADEAEIFAAWAITVGCGWFNIKLKTPLGYYNQVCRFTETPQGPQLVGANLWTYKTKAEMRGRAVIDSTYGEFLPDILLLSDIFDLAMNEAWPE